MPVPLGILSGVVKISAFPRLKSGIFDLILKKISHSRTASGDEKRVWGRKNEGRAIDKQIVFRVFCGKLAPKVIKGRFFICVFNLVGLVKSQKAPFLVFPAKDGIQYFDSLQNLWTPVFTGVTTFYETINLGFFITF